MSTLRLFNRNIYIDGRTNHETLRLLYAVENYQRILSDITRDIQDKIVSNYDPALDFSVMRGKQMGVKMDKAQAESLMKATNSVADALIFRSIDFGQKIVVDIFSNTLVDILVQSVFDNTILTDDPFMQKALIYWERRVICPMIDHLVATGRLDILNNETLIGEAKVMESWVKYDGDTKRGMYHTIGAMMSKGFFFALRIPCSTPFVPVPFIGNLVCWALLTTDPEIWGHIKECFILLNHNPAYRPSIGVCKKILSFEPGAFKHVPLDVITDFKIGVGDLRDAVVPNNITYQVEVLGIAKSIVLAKMGGGSVRLSR
jgi:hypothetical protein